MINSNQIEITVAIISNRIKAARHHSLTALLLLIAAGSLIAGDVFQIRWVKTPETVLPRHDIAVWYEIRNISGESRGMINNGNMLHARFTATQHGQVSECVDDSFSTYQSRDFSFPPGWHRLKFVPLNCGVGYSGGFDLRVTVSSEQSEPAGDYDRDWHGSVTSPPAHITMLVPTGEDFKVYKGVMGDVDHHDEIILRDYPDSTYAGYALVNMQRLVDPILAAAPSTRAGYANIAVEQPYYRSLLARGEKYLATHPDFYIAPLIRQQMASAAFVLGDEPLALKHLGALAAMQGDEAEGARWLLARLSRKEPPLLEWRWLPVPAVLPRGALIPLGFTVQNVSGRAISLAELSNLYVTVSLAGPKAEPKPPVCKVEIGQGFAVDPRPEVPAQWMTDGVAWLDCPAMAAGLYPVKLDFSRTTYLLTNWRGENLPLPGGLDGRVQASELVLEITEPLGEDRIVYQELNHSQSAQNQPILAAHPDSTYALYRNYQALIATMRGQGALTRKIPEGGFRHCGGYIPDGKVRGFGHASEEESVRWRREVLAVAERRKDRPWFVDELRLAVILDQIPAGEYDEVDGKMAGMERAALPYLRRRLTDYRTQLRDSDWKAKSEVIRKKPQLCIIEG